MKVVEDMIQKQEYQDRFRALITSPPYFQQRSYGSDSKEIGREKTVEEYLDKLTYVFTLCRDLLSKDGSLWIVIGDTRRKSGKLNVPHRLTELLVRNGYYLRDDLVWYKRNHVSGSSKQNFTSAYESILYFSKERRCMVDRLTGPRKGISNVWDIATRAHSGQEHYAMFPEQLIERIIKVSTKPSDHVIDVFAGRGTTGIVCMKTHRYFTGIDLYPSFVKAARSNVKLVSQEKWN